MIQRIDPYRPSEPPDLDHELPETLGRCVVLPVGVENLGQAPGQRAPVEASRLEFAGLQFKFRVIVAKEIAAIAQIRVLGDDHMHCQRRPPRTAGGEEIDAVGGLSHIGFASTHCRFTSAINSFRAASPRCLRTPA